MTSIQVGLLISITLCVVNCMHPCRRINVNFILNFTSGALTGFVDLGSITMHLANFERQVENGSEEAERPLTKTMLVVMVRGLFSGL